MLNFGRVFLKINMLLFLAFLKQSCAFSVACYTLKPEL